MENRVEVQAVIDAKIRQVWHCWTTPADVMNWNFAIPEWECPAAENDLQVGGKFNYKMAAKDGSFTFDFWGIYNVVEENRLLNITLGDGRFMEVSFEEVDGGTLVRETFELENENPRDLQEAGWQAILDNFKKYVESL